MLGDLNDGANEPLHDPRDDRHDLFGNIVVVVRELRHCRSTWLWNLEMVPIRAVASLLFCSFEEARRKASVTSPSDLLVTLVTGKTETVDEPISTRGWSISLFRL